MFDSLSEKLLSSIKRLKGQSKITESNIEDTLREIRLSLLEADVHFKVVKTFIERVKAKALGQQVTAQITAGQEFVKIVHDELVSILGGGASRLELKDKPSVVFLVGLQGAGKTTTAAKLALHLKKDLGKRPGLVSVDVYRPSAIEQLKVLSEKNDLLFLHSEVSEKPEQIVKRSKKWAEDNLIDVIIVDTAGRLQIDENLMDELKRLKLELPPHEVLLVADAMLGQQSVNVAEGFHSQVGLTGLVLTKVDGDARGGAALSIREATGVPIKLMGIGEKIDALEVFHPDRLASRILDMGDVLTLVEKAKNVMDEKSAKDSMKKMARGEFTVEDFLAQIQQIKKLGSMEGILKMIPGMGQALKQVKNMAPPDKEIKKIEAIIQSMTLKERQDHNILNGSRRLRIAKGSGTQVSDVNKFIKQFVDSKKMMSQMMKMGLGRMGQKGGGMGFPF
jgi:signal recognition particle subunit SRP54